MSWKNVKEFYNEFSFKNSVGSKSVTIETALEGIEVAEKLKWKYPEKNEFPNEKQIVLGISKKNQTYHLVTYDKEFKQFYKDDDFGIGILCWCELPVFNKA